MRVSAVLSGLLVVAALSGCGGGKQEPEGAVEVVKTPEPGVAETPAPEAPAPTPAVEKAAPPVETPAATPTPAPTPASTLAPDTGTTQTVTPETETTEAQAAAAALRVTPVPVTTEDALRPLQSVTEVLPKAGQDQPLQPEQMSQLRERVAAMPAGFVSTLPEGDSRRQIITETSEQVLEKLDELGPGASAEQQKQALEEVRARLQEAETVLREKSQPK